MLLCSWAGVSNPMDSNGSEMPIEATSSAVWAPGKQSHRPCYSWHSKAYAASLRANAR